MFLKTFLSSRFWSKIKLFSTKASQDYKKRKLTKTRHSKSKSSSNPEPRGTCRRIIVDCDVGTDDAVALYLLLSAELRKLVKIEMICCTRGNTTRHHVCRNTVRLLEIARRTDIPIYRGSYETLLFPGTEEYYHGIDGFGDLKHDSEPNLSIIRPEPAYAAMKNLIMNNPKDITVVGLAPLTNIALVMRLYDNVVANIKELFIMGGNHLGIGNVTQSGEFNFYMDPEAAHIVLTQADCPLYLMTWEACLGTKIPLQWRMDNLGQNGGETWQLIDRAERKVYKRDDGYWLPCDAFLVAAMLYPEIVLKRIRRHIDIELAGSFTRGQVAVDHINKKVPNATIIQKIDRVMFQDLMSSIYTEF